MKDGDVAGLSCFQNRYGFVGVKRENGQFFVVMQKAMDEFDGATGADDDSEGDEGEGGGSQSGNPDEGEDQDGGNDRAKALLAQIKKITDQTKED